MKKLLFIILLIPLITFGQEYSWERGQFSTAGGHQSGGTYTVTTAVGQMLQGEATNGEEDVLYGFLLPHLDQRMPLITNITDVPADQGKQVFVNWDKCGYDLSYVQDNFYSLWRLDSVPGDPDALIINDPDDLSWAIKQQGHSLFYWLNGNELWSFVGEIPAIADTAYSVVAPTLMDSCASGMKLSTFKVLFHDQYELYSSDPASGYSVDNLAPAPPALAGEFIDPQVELEWDASDAEDFQYYALYKSDEEGFFPEEPYSLTTDTTFTDGDLSSDIVYYQVTAYDFNGNESESSNVVQLEVTTTGATQAYSLDFGYQFVSTRIQPEEPDMQEVVEALLPDLDFVRNTAGLMLRKVGPNWVNSIGEWITKEGYLFRMNNPSDALIIAGTAMDPLAPIPVEEGYQFISYLPDYPIDAQAAVENILENMDFMRNSQGDMLRKIGPNWVNGIGDMAPGEGYLVRMNAADELVYNLDGFKSGIAHIYPTHFRFQGGNAADPVYTVYISSGNGISIGDEIAAFDGDKMVGSVKLVSSNWKDNELALFSTLNNGKGYTAGNTIRFEVWDQDKGNELPLQTSYRQVYNSWMTPEFPGEDGRYSVIEFSKSAILLANGQGSELSVYPVPASDVLHIRSTSAIDHLRIITNTGKVLIQKMNQENNLDLDVSGIPTGVYVVRIQLDQNITTKKVIIR
ncbi:MAG: T9SS type A sorting domain-containing protein [Bacteroidales bacterium]|nr:T9SS type A sorting domain-containing protein [Bacteroidales bacterium]